MLVSKSVHIVRDKMRVACPECSKSRKKKNSKDCVITRKPDGSEVFYCHHCGASGIRNNKKEFKQRTNMKIYEGSQNKNLAARKKDTEESQQETFKQESKMFKPHIVRASLEDEHLQYLKSRGISKETANAVGLFAAEKWFSRLQKKTKSIGFPYVKNGEVVSIKYRSLEGKDFTQDSSGSSILFNMNSVDTDKPLVITEGEIDTLTLVECGVDNVVSVPTGAPLKVSEGRVDPSEDTRFKYIWNAHTTINKIKKIIIATDNDESGKALAEELARRLGKDKCYLVDFSAYKDFNEVLLKDGKDTVLKILNSASPYPVQGLEAPSAFEKSLNILRTEGTGRGCGTGYKSLDEIYSVVEGQLTIVTGYPSSGKSNFVDQLMVNIAKEDEWKFAVCSFENAPELHIARLMEIKQNRRFFDGSNKMTEEEHQESFKWVNDHFIFLTHESSEPSTIDSILDRLKIAVARTGIRGAVIDPYNYIIMEGDGSETEKISTMLTRVQSFAKSYGVHIWFVCHPAKMQRYGNELPRPDGMSISGSMSWWAKADVGITIYRLDKNTEVNVWKCRYRWVGKTGITELNYDNSTGTYSEISDPFG